MNDEISKENFIKHQILRMNRFTFLEDLQTMIKETLKDYKTQYSLGNVFTKIIDLRNEVEKELRKNKND